MSNLYKYEDLIKILDYNEVTGLLFWKISPNQSIPEGSIAGYLSRGYIQVTYEGSSYKAHRLAWLFVYKEINSEHIDHINRIRSDNRISNLREANHSQNCLNSKVRFDNTSGYKGISKHGHKWRVRIHLNETRITVGYYKSLEEAVEAYNDFVTCHGTLFHTRQEIL